MRTSDAFNNKKAFISFITCGDPNLETTEELLLTMEKGGVDLIELGIPFSDPTAEGPVIQGANSRALSTGVTTDKIFDMVRRVRPKLSVPLVFMTYANVVFSYGIERFVKTAAEVGMSGIILPDVPFEEKDEFAEICEQYGIDFISLIAPTSDERISTIAKEAKGFIYCVSSLGVTGMRNSITTDISAIVKKVRENTDIPVAVGFGISTPEQAADISKKADGIIIGSAIVKIIAEHGENSVPYVYDFVKSVKDAMLNLRSAEMERLTYTTLRDYPELKDAAASWFHSKWGVPKEAYLECMDKYLKNETEYGWYLCLDGNKIVGGMGVIENDFHDRKDLSPNVCAVYTEEAYRKNGIAGHLLDMTVEDLKSKGITPVYLVTDHTGFYERYGWEFLCMVQGDGDPDMTRMYIHR